MIPAGGLLGEATVIASGWVTWPGAVGANCTVTFSVAPGARLNAPTPAVTENGATNVPNSAQEFASTNVFDLETQGFRCPIALNRAERARLVE